MDKAADWGWKGRGFESDTGGNFLFLFLYFENIARKLKSHAFGVFALLAAFREYCTQSVVLF